MLKTARGSRHSRASFQTVLLLAAIAGSAFAQQQPSTPAPAASPSAGSGPKIDWHKGPYTTKLGDIAEIKVPEGYEFTGGDGARRLLELTGNPSDNHEIGVLQPIADDKNNQWWILFEFDETGYVKDDEKGSIDAPGLMEKMTKATEDDNVERKKRGWKPFHLTGWQTAPFYDETTHNLTWATLGKTDDPKDDATINYATRLLGRHGVVRVDLITDPETIDATLPRFKSLMSGFAFTAGSRYADFVKGDKVAEYGLTALIAGGATAIAIKTGFFAKLLAMLAGLWKLIALGFAALLTRVKNIVEAIKRKFARKSGFKSEAE